MARVVRHLPGIIAAASVLLVACDGSRTHVACDDVADSMAVQIDYSTVLRLHPQALTVRACVERDCGMQIVPSGRNRLSSMTLGQGALRAGHAAGVTLLITDDAGHEVFAGDVGITPGAGQQQGASECPTAWIGQAVAKGSHTLQEVTSG